MMTKSDLLEKQKGNPLGVDDLRKKDINLVIRTSGSTGIPLTVSMNPTDVEKITDVGARCFKNAGVTPGMKIIHCLNFQMWAGGYLDFTSLLKSGACAFPYGVGNTKELINTIMYYDIEGISCTPSYMKRLKTVLQEEFHMDPKNLGLKYGFFGGESGLQNPSFRKKIEDEWHIEAINANYGSADSISILASENYYTKDGLVFLADEIAHPLIKTEEGDLVVPKKGVIGELLITTDYEGGLIKRTEYSLGDIVEVLSNGSNFKFKVLGRSDEMIVIKGLNVYPNTIQNIVSEAGLKYNALDIVSQLQVSISDPIEDAILMIDYSGDKDRDGIIAFIQKEMKDRLSLNIPVHVGVLEMSENGKVKSVRRILS